MAPTMDKKEAPDQPKNDPSPTRKRVGKACDRCRNKKSKCNGLQSCARCVADNELCLYSQRDKTQDKVWPKGTVETMQKQRDIMADTIFTLYKKAFPETQSEQVPSVHEIAVQMDCMGSEACSARAICQLHETLAEGFLRLRTLGECPKCTKKWHDEETDIIARRKMAWSVSEYDSFKQSQGSAKVSPQPKNAGVPSQTPRQSSFMPLKQEEYPLKFPRATSNAMNQHVSPHPTQSRPQNQQRPAVLNSGMRGHNVLPPGTPIDHPPTPAYSPDQIGPKRENPFTVNPNPNAFVNPQYQGASIGPHGFNGYVPCSMAPCDDTYNLQQILAQGFAPESPVIDYVNPQLLQPSDETGIHWEEPLNYPL